MIASQPLTCEWRDGKRCQFVSLQLPIAVHHGRPLCRAHAPPGAPDAMPSDELGQFLNGFLAQRNRDLSGLHFGRKSDAWRFASHTSEPLVFQHCVFDGGGAPISVESRAIFDDSNFLAPMDLQLSHSASMRRTVFERPISFFVPAHVALDLVDAEVKDDVRFHCISTATIGALKLDRVSFHRAPRFSGHLSQATTFHGTQFLSRTPEDEATYRDLRNKLNENRAREWEGIAYELEQVCQRRAHFREHRWFAWFTSLLYGTLARYGHSYERAWLSFAAMQVAFGLLYSWRSGRLGCCNFDRSIFLYTFAQLLKPFDGLSAKPSQTTPHWVQEVVRDDVSIFWPVATALQSLASLALIALALLAMRWRFRRE